MNSDRICKALLFQCPIHGLQDWVRTSRDLCEGHDKARSRDDVVNLVYTIEGEAFLRFHVSRAFATAHGLVAGVREGQDDDLFDWDRYLVKCCVKCFLQKNGGWFDENSWWHPGEEPTHTK